MALLVEYLRGQIVWRPAYRIRFFLLAVLLRKTEICQLQIAIFVNQNVLWLEAESIDTLLAVDDVFAVQVFQRQYHLTSIEFNPTYQSHVLILAEFLAFAKQPEQFPTGTVFHH